MKIVGIDVQRSRGFAFATIDEHGHSGESGWIRDPNDETIVDRLILDLELPEPPGLDIAIGIDAPRVPITTPRPWYWDGSRQLWRARREAEQGHGRHCEVVIKAHNLANPQWTRFQHESPAWMKMGFRLFAHLAAYTHVYEVFPSAAYKQLTHQQVLVQIDLANFAAGPKDMLDAYVAAVTVREYLTSQGEAVGDGDGLGAIILPRHIANPIKNVLKYPPVQE